MIRRHDYGHLAHRRSQILRGDRQLWKHDEATLALGGPKTDLTPVKRALLAPEREKDALQALCERAYLA